MQRELWKEKRCNREAFSRAGGRRRHNAMRKFFAACRQIMLLKMCGNGYIRLFLDRGVQAQMARELGVSKATISRDVKLIRSVYLSFSPYSTSGRPLIPTIEQMIEAVKERTGFTKTQRKLSRETNREVAETIKI